MKDSKVTIEGKARPGAPIYNIKIICDWGDGTCEKCSLPASHNYLKSGIYNITLKVIQSDGTTLSKPLKVKITSSSPSNTLLPTEILLTIVFFTTLITLTMLKYWLKKRRKHS